MSIEFKATGQNGKAFTLAAENMSPGKTCKDIYGNEYVIISYDGDGYNVHVCEISEYLKKSTVINTGLTTIKELEIQLSELGFKIVKDTPVYEAAPDMYEALKEIELSYTRCVECHNLRENGHDYNCKLGKALSKAEGKEVL